MTYQNKNRTISIHLILIIILGFFVYFNSLNGGFILDDDLLVKDNVYIRNWSHVQKIFTKYIGAGGGKEDYFYRPIQISTYLINYSFHKLDVLGYHLVNVLLHVLVALCLYWLIGILFKDRFISFCTAILFVLHPIHTEAVAYVSGRADPLVVLFMLLCFIAYINYSHRQRISFFIICLTYILAVLSKEYSLIFPFLLLLYHCAFKVNLKPKVGPFLSILSIWFIYIGWRFVMFSFPVNQEGQEFLVLLPRVIGLFKRLPGFFVSLFEYLKLLLFPFNLHMEYGYKLFSYFEPRAILGAAVFIMLLFTIFYSKRKKGLIFFSSAWFIITLMPQSNIFSLNAFMAEHWLYFPSVGFFLLLAYCLKKLYLINRYRKIIASAALIILIVFYSLLTIKQNVYWKGPKAFFKHTLAYSSGSARVFNNLANISQKEGRYEGAISLYKRAMMVDPEYVEAYNNLGVMYIDTKRPSEAVPLYKKALEINPRYAKAYNNLGNAYRMIGKTGDAISSYNKAIELNPEYVDAYYNLGLISSASGNFLDAVSFYKKAIKLDSGYINAYNNLGLLLYLNLGQKEEAISCFVKAIQLDPDFADAHNNLAVAYYYKKQQYDLAIKHCDIAIKLGYDVNPKFLELLEPHRK